MQFKKELFMKFKKSEKKNEVNSESCCSLVCCCSDKELFNKKSRRCPVCGKKGIFVNSETVKDIIKENKEFSLSEKFYLCKNPDCEVLYFSQNNIFYRKDSTKDIDFKKGTKTKYACYCNNLTYDEVNEIVERYKKTDWAFIVKTAKGRIAKSDCLHKNPYGRCCVLNSFKKAVDEAILKFKGVCL